MTTPKERQSTPLSAAEDTDGPEPVAKKSRNRKAAKKPVPHSSTLRGLWGVPNTADEPSVGAIDDAKISVSSAGGERALAGKKGGQPIVFKITPSRLAAAIESSQLFDPFIISPQPSPDVVFETPVQTGGDVERTPKSSRDSQRKRSFQQSPSEGVRRSPRNHRAARESTPTPIIKPVTTEKKTHPFFLGKEARISFLWII
jgi:hypothetical protein